MDSEEAFSTKRDFVITVPVKCGSKLKALRRRKSQAVVIRDENEQRHESLITRTGQSEVTGLLGGIGHVAAQH
jgi:hypothetical protein